jgi:hypothetical protein
VAQLFSLGGFHIFMKTKRTMKQRVMLTGALLVGLLAVYAFSSGPAVYLGERGMISRHVIQATYRPLLAVTGHSGVCHEYIMWWYKKGH